jgi:hypothetical protein
MVSKCQWFSELPFACRPHEVHASCGLWYQGAILLPVWLATLVRAAPYYFGYLGVPVLHGIVHHLPRHDSILLQ